MDDLERLAQNAVDSKIYDKEFNSYIKERWGIVKKQHRIFIQELLKGQASYRAYQIAYGTSESPGSIKSALSASSRLKKELNIEWSECLEWCGHGDDSVIEALDDIKEKDSDSYLKHITKLKGYDIKKIELTGSLDLPNITIVGFDGKEE